MVKKYRSRYQNMIQKYAKKLKVNQDLMTSI